MVLHRHGLLLFLVVVLGASVDGTCVLRGDLARPLAPTNATVSVNNGIVACHGCDSVQAAAFAGLVLGPSAYLGAVAADGVLAFIYPPSGTGRGLLLEDVPSPVFLDYGITGGTARVQQVSPHCAFEWNDGNNNNNGSKTGLVSLPDSLLPCGGCCPSAVICENQTSCDRLVWSCSSPDKNQWLCTTPGHGLRSLFDALRNVSTVPLQQQQTTRSPPGYCSEQTVIVHGLEPVHGDVVASHCTAASPSAFDVYYATVVQVGTKAPCVAPSVLSCSAEVSYVVSSEFASGAAISVASPFSGYSAFTDSAECNWTVTNTNMDYDGSDGLVLHSDSVNFGCSTALGSTMSSSSSSSANGRQPVALHSTAVGDKVVTLDSLGGVTVRRMSTNEIGAAVIVSSVCPSPYKRWASSLVATGDILVVTGALDKAYPIMVASVEIPDTGAPFAMVGGTKDSTTRMETALRGPPGYSCGQAYVGNEEKGEEEEEEEKKRLINRIEDVARAYPACTSSRRGLQLRVVPAASAEECPPSSHLPSWGVGCLPCPAGTFSGAWGATECTRCPETGSICPPGASAPIPFNSSFSTSVVARPGMEDQVPASLDGSLTDSIMTMLFVTAIVSVSVACCLSVCWPFFPYPVKFAVIVMDFLGDRRDKLCPFFGHCMVISVTMLCITGAVIAILFVRDPKNLSVTTTPTRALGSHSLVQADAEMAKYPTRWTATLEPWPTELCTAQSFVASPDPPVPASSSIRIENVRCLAPFAQAYCACGVTALLDLGGTATATAATSRPRSSMGFSIAPTPEAAALGGSFSQRVLTVKQTLSVEYPSAVADATTTTIFEHPPSFVYDSEPGRATSLGFAFAAGDGMVLAGRTVNKVMYRTHLFEYCDTACKPTDQTHREFEYGGIEKGQVPAVFASPGTNGTTMAPPLVLTLAMDRSRTDAVTRIVRGTHGFSAFFIWLLFCSVVVGGGSQLVDGFGKTTWPPEEFLYNINAYMHHLDAIRPRFYPFVGAGLRTRAYGVPFQPASKEHESLENYMPHRVRVAEQQQQQQQRQNPDPSAWLHGAIPKTK